MPQKCVERCCEEQLYKVSSPCFGWSSFKKEELESVGELSKVLSQIVLKCLYLARIGRPDILWSVNKLARSFTKWTRVCDKRSAVGFLIFINDYRQYCHVGNTAQHCRWGLFQDADFAGHLEDSISTSGDLVCLWKSNIRHHWLDVQETNVSIHNSTGSEIISSDVSLRTDGIPALDLSDVVIEVLRSSNSIKPPTIPAAGNCSRNHKSNPKQKGKPRSWSIVACGLRHHKRTLFSRVSPSGTSLKTMKQLLLIKINIKGRSPTMTRVKNPQSCSWWLFDIINLDPKIQIKYIDTKNQLADILTKGISTRDEWNHLLNLFNTSHFRSTACTAAMAKRSQRVTAKSRPMMNLTTRTPSVVSSSTSSKTGEDLVWISRSWRICCDKRSIRRNLIDCHQQVIQKRIMVDIGLLKSGKVELQSEAAEFVNKVKDQVRKRQKRMSNVADSGEEHSIIWGMFMATTLNAATFMGKNFMDNQNSIMNSTDLTLKQMFDITAKVVDAARWDQ